MINFVSIVVLLAAFPNFYCDESFFAKNEATSNKDMFQIWAVLLCCIGFCVLIRHLNDFFTGGTKTLVEEGLWGSRFKHRKQYGQLQHVEKDFAKMYYEITKADKNKFEIRGRDIVEEVETDSDHTESESQDDECTEDESQTASYEETQSTMSTDTKSK
uniref:Uncharacterized protein n=1 Tax=Acrobeloides nanus TaxID=290746 RepID=A0A914E5E9_9BILA